MQKLFFIFKRSQYLLVLVLAVFIPLYPKFPLIGISKTFVSIRLEDFLIALVVGIWLFVNIKRLKFLYDKTIVKAFLLFWFIGALSTLSGYFITHSVDPSLGFLHWFRRIEYMSIFLVAATSFKSMKQVRIVMKVMLFTATIVILYGFGQIYLNFPVISTTNSEFSKGIVLYLTNNARVNSTFAGHYDLAVYLMFVLTLVTALFFYQKNGVRTLNIKNILVKLQLLVVGITGFILLGLTAARVSFFATLVGLSMVFWLSKKKILVIGLIAVSLLLVFAIPELRHRLVATFTVNILGGGGPKYDPAPGTVTIFTPVKDIPQEQREQVLEQAKKDATDPAKQNKAIPVDTVPGEPINTTELGVFRSFGIRLNVEWPRALNAFLKNPFLGTGYSSISLATDNDILRSLGETGILGTLSLGLIFWMIIKKMLFFLKNTASEYLTFERCFIISMLSSLVGLLITATFIDVLEASKVAEVFWLLMGVSWSILTRYDFDQE